MKLPLLPVSALASVLLLSACGGQPSSSSSVASSSLAPSSSSVALISSSSVAPSSSSVAPSSSRVASSSSQARVNQAPVIAALSDVMTNAGQAVQVSANVSDAEGDALSYQWNFANQTLTTPQFNYTFATAGTYTVTLRVTDSASNQATRSFIIRVAAETLPSTDNVWSTVQIQGGGYVTGLVYSKADASVLYARTDVGGAYRWNGGANTWKPLTDSFTSGNDWGVWSLAADPSDANKVYMATGLYSADWGQNGAIFYSDDKGDSWDKISTLSFKLGGNDPGRGTAERLQVDPNKPSTLLLGSKKDGLFKSTDAGVSWSKVTTLAASYITFVAFDKSSGSTGNATPTIYVGVADNIYNGGNVGVYRSTNGGTSWSKLPNHPTAMAAKAFEVANPSQTPVPMNMVFAGSNLIYVVFNNTVTPDGEFGLAAQYQSISNGAVYKFNKATSAWTTVTPANAENLQGGFGAIDVSQADANTLVLSTIGRWWPADEIYFSTDAGATWTTSLNSYFYASTWGNSLNKGVMTAPKAPHGGEANMSWLSCVVMNPLNPNHVMVTSGMGVFMSYDVSSLLTNTNPENTAKTTWLHENEGLEETVPLELISPASGVPLVSALGDIDGFVHSNLDQSPTAGRHNTDGTHVGTTRSIAFAQNVPSKMVKAFDNNAKNKGAYSTNGGVTWTSFAAKPAGVGANDSSGQITISADGARMVWGSQKVTMAYSTNNGASWNASTGIPTVNLKPIADRVNSQRFYAFDPENQVFYSSSNGAAAFTSKSLNLSGIPTYISPQPELDAVFGKEGHLWLANYEHGLMRTTNGGQTWTTLNNVSSAFKVTFGKAATANGYPAVYIWGVVSGVNGLFRSDDEGANWIRINDDEHEWARAHTTLEGDQRIYGRLYVGLGGRGIVYGDVGCARNNSGACK